LETYIFMQLLFFVDFQHSNRKLFCIVCAHHLCFERGFRLPFVPEVSHARPKH
jgi:hypothetical protein